VDWVHLAQQGLVVDILENSNGLISSIKVESLLAS